MRDNYLSDVGIGKKVNNLMERSTKPKNLGQELNFHLNRTQANKNKNLANEMSIKRSFKPDAKYQELVRRLKVALGESYADERVKLGYKDFLSQIDARSDIIIGNGKPSLRSNHRIFGKQLLIDLFIECMEPTLKSVFHEGSIGMVMLKQARMWPLRDSLAAFSLKQCNEVLNDVIQAYDEQYLCSGYPFTQEGDFYYENSLLEKDVEISCESLKTLSDALSVMYEYDKQEWCKYCFRMAVAGTLYCNKHSPKLDDSNYRRAGKKIWSYKDLKAFKEYQYLRYILGNEPVLAIPGKIPLHGPNIICVKNNAEALFYEATNSVNWEDVKTVWISAIEKQLPHVNSVIAKTNYKGAGSWLDFVVEIFKGLDEWHDKVTHPYWIKRILEFAEIWFYLEKRETVDKRKNNTKSQILELHAQGIKPIEIGKILGKSSARVSSVIATNSRLQKQKKQEYEVK